MVEDYCALKRCSATQHQQHEPTASYLCGSSSDQGFCRSSDGFPAQKLRKGTWRPVQLRIGRYSLDRLDAEGAGPF